MRSDRLSLVSNINYSICISIRHCATSRIGFQRCSSCRKWKATIPGASRKTETCHREWLHVNSSRQRCAIIFRIKLPAAKTNNVYSKFLPFLGTNGPAGKPQKLSTRLECHCEQWRLAVKAARGSKPNGRALSQLSENLPLVFINRDLMEIPRENQKPSSIDKTPLKEIFIISSMTSRVQSWASWKPDSESFGGQKKASPSLFANWAKDFFFRCVIFSLSIFGVYKYFSTTLFLSTRSFVIRFYYLIKRNFRCGAPHSRWRKNLDHARSSLALRRNFPFFVFFGETCEYVFNVYGFSRSGFMVGWNDSKWFQTPSGFHQPQPCLESSQWLCSA